MSENAFGFNDLTNEAQDTALASFAKHYVRQYKQDNLEIIDALANDDEAVAMINQFLEENQYLTIDKLAELSLAMVKPSYVTILSDLNAQFDENGEPIEDWDVWMREEHAQLPRED